MTPTTDAAVSASLACARALGLPTGSPEVVAEGFSVRVRLRPAPVLTRVVTTGQDLRGDPRPWLEREVAVAQFLSATPVSVVKPWRDAGPHLAEGLDVSLWTWVDHETSGVSGETFGAMLGELHAALASYEEELPPLVGPLTDIATALGVSDDPVLHQAAETLVPRALSWPRRPLHGDAHRGNLLATPEGACWIDFEDVCVGPVEWDLASLTVDQAAIDAYPGPIDAVRLEECRDLRRLQILSTLLVMGIDEPALHDRLVTRLRRFAPGSEGRTQ